MKTWQRIGLIGFALIIVITTVVFTRERSPDDINSTNKTTPTDNTAASLGAARFPARTTSGLVMFNSDLGRFERIQGSERLPLATPAETPGDVAYDPTGKLVATRSRPNEGTAGPWTIMELASGRVLTTLNPNISALAFAPDGKRMIYHYRDETTSNLSIANVDGSDWQSVLDVPQGLSRLWWITPLTRVIYQVDDWETLSTTNVLVGLSSRSRISIEPLNRDLRPSPAGEYLLTGTNDLNSSASSTLELVRISAEGIAENTALPYLTLPDLTAWNSTGTTLYLISSPFNTPELVQLDPRTKQATTITTSTELAELLRPTAIDIARARLISVDEQLLYLSYDGVLWTLTLPQS